MSRSWSRRAACVAALAAFSLLISPVPAAAAPPGWTDPVAIRTQSSGIEQLRVGVSSTGRLSIVGVDTLGLFALEQRSGGWRFIRLAKDRLVEGPIAGVFDRDGHAWLVYRHGCTGSDCTQAGLYLFTNRYGGPNDGWPAARKLLVSGPAKEPAFQVSGSGRLHLAYTDKKSRLHYRTALRAAGPWTDTLVWGDDLAMQPVMVLDPDGHPNLAAWHVTAPGGSAGIAWARDIGRPGEPSFRTRTVPGTTEYDGSPLLAFDPNGHARLTWYEDPYCGVGDCPPEPSRGTWTRAWTGSKWSAAKQLSSRRTFSLRITPGGRARVLVEGPSMVRQTASGWRTTVLVQDPTYVEAGAMALTVGGKARVVFSDITIKPHWSASIHLMKEQ